MKKQLGRRKGGKEVERKRERTCLCGISRDVFSELTLLNRYQNNVKVPAV